MNQGAAQAAPNHSEGERTMDDKTRAALIDAAAMLEHYALRRTSNWDGSTERQAFVLIKEINALLREGQK